MRSVVKDLMRRLMKRGFHCDRRLYAELDGNEALRSAVKEFFPETEIQRSLVHKSLTSSRSYRRSTGASWLDCSNGFAKSRDARRLSFALLEAEKGFRRISGCDDLPKLMAALERENDSLAKKSPTGLPAATRKEVEQLK